MNNTIAYKLAQLPKDILVAGIDPHKHQHAIVIQNLQAQNLTKFKINNDHAGFENLLRRCEQLQAQEGASQVVFSIEPGSHYWRNLAYYLEENKQMVRLINPFTLKRQRDGDDLMRRKNDYRDASAAADLLRQGKYTWTRLPKDVYAELRTAHDTYQQLVEDESRVCIQLTTALDGLFPEFQQVFKALGGQTALAVLQTCPDPARIASLELSDFISRVAKTFSRPRLMYKKLYRLHETAKHSIGIQEGSEALVRRINLMAIRLVFLKQQRQQAEVDLLNNLDACPEKPFLLSMFGLGPINAAGILAHIGDISQYSSVKQLSKLAGIVPIQNESAGHTGQKTPMSKKGRNGLRTVTYRSVVALLRHNQGFIKYVKNLQNRSGSNHPLRKREALGAAMNKLLRIIYALLVKRQPFDLAQAFAA